MESSSDSGSKSESESDSPDSSPDKKKNKKDKKKTGKGKKKVKKSKEKEMGPKAPQRDRNTVVATAPIAELFIPAPNRYKDILDGHKTGRVKRAMLTSECSLAIEQDSAIKENPKTLKNNNKLLPLTKK
ncbi:coiled-coil domain-containing protein 106-like [Xyrichtys novacula]|uniref:Coiled-coil domain-containing protein 106-like n=1 Tax=Xyrichtys novacula TaxID=13765 RepID=A0AAV1G030_XYRNO|nr:coiled-coil domain-containing protein 106-like [Xyrichtys novacula]